MYDFDSEKGFNWVKDMNILLINHYAGSPEMGMEFRPYYFAREWVKKGHRVDIFAASYSHLRRVNPKVRHDFQEEIIDGIHYHWIKTVQYEGNGAKRAITMAQFVWKLWINAKKITKKFKPDVVIASSTYPIDTFVGQKIRRLSKKKIKLIHEVHDMWPSTLYEIGGMSKKHPFVRIMQWGENSAYKYSDKVVSLLPYSEKYMRKHGLKRGKFVCIPNGILEDEWENPKELSLKHADVLQNIKNRGDFIVGYFGGHALSNALDVLLNAAKRINDEKIKFVLVGNGVEKSRLIKRVQLENINNVLFLPPVTKLEIPSLCQYFDCIFYSGVSSPLYRFGVCPNKMFDSMRAGKPNICAAALKHSYIDEYKFGVCINPDNIEEVVQSIVKIKNMSESEREDMGKRGIEAALNHFNYKVLSDRFLELV